jgi:TatD DNase family protein
MFKGRYNGKERHPDDTVEVMERARSMGVKKCILTAGTVDDSRITMDLVLSLRSEEKGGFDVVSTVGVHPTRCNEFIGQEDSVVASLSELIEEGIASKMVVAVGEAGLDYDRLQFCEKQVQMVGFLKQIDLAAKYKLPMFLHNRNTAGDFVRVVRENREKIQGGGVVHSFDGGMEEMQELVDLGFYIGINGCSLRQAENMAVAAAVPLDHLLMETDSPYCGVKNSHAGSSFLQTKFATKKKEKWVEGTMIKDRNEPCTMVQILEILAHERGMDANELAEAIYINSQRLFFPAELTLAD